MHMYTASAKRGFTLIELLAVVAIIALLIGLLVPTVSSVRDQAKRAAVSAQLDSIGKGCEQFHAEMDQYPRSFGQNPFESGSGVYLSGAQWLALQLVGADFEGYIKPDRTNDTNGDSDIDHVDWREWYDNDSDFARLPPYVDVSGRIAITPKLYADQTGLELPDQLKAGSSDYSNENLAFFVDSYEAPILYYRANPRAKHPFSKWDGSSRDLTGRYDQIDNEIFTGSDVEDGFDLGGGQHKIKKLGWQEGQTSKPDDDTFAQYFYDRQIFEQSKSRNQPKIWPHRPETFILISPGKDLIYGTSDDVKNF